MDGINRVPPSPPQANTPPTKPVEDQPAERGLVGGLIDKVGQAADKVSQDVKDRADKTKEEIGKVLDPFLYADSIDIALTNDSYKNIKLEDAAKMLGYFMQKMQNQGFPWKLCEIKGGKLKRRVALSEMDAVRRLAQGKEVLFQPKRNLQLDLSPDSLSAAAKLGGDPLKKVDEVAALSKSTKVQPANEGIEVRFGEPVIVKSFGELKLLYEMYNPDVTVEEKNELGKVAHGLSFFTKKTLGTNYPWRFIKEGEGKPVWRALKSVFTKGIPGALVGGGIGLMIGGPIGLFTGAWAAAMTLSTYGAVAGGALMAVEGARTAAKGEEINAFETLDRVLDKKPVMFQERKKHSVNVPILGTFSWFSDYGKGSTITNTEELELFNKMQDQA
jgi:hypothetical protein